MKCNPQIHHRRSIRLEDYDYSSEGAYFVTMCTQNSECLFGEIVNGQMILNEYGKIVQQCWNDLPIHYDNIALDAYVIMPDHFHGIILITDNVDNVGAIHELPRQRQDELPRQRQDELPRQRQDELPRQRQQQQQRRKMLLPKIVGRFKMNSAKKINQMRNTPGISVWQRNYYEHIIHDEKSLQNIRKYIINNPLQWYYDNNA